MDRSVLGVILNKRSGIDIQTSTQFKVQEVVSKHQTWLLNVND